MQLRRWIGILASVGAGLLAPLSAHALPVGFSDLLEVVDGNGNVMTDLNGNPAIAMIPEGSLTPVHFSLEVPDVVPFSTAGIMGLVEAPPDPITHQALVSDVVDASLLSSSSTFKALLGVRLTSDGGHPHVDTCQEVGPGQCLLETGALQDVTAVLFPDRQLSFHVLVQSQPAEVPEPASLPLLAIGIASIGLVTTRRRV